MISTIESVSSSVPTSNVEGTKNNDSNSSTLERNNYDQFTVTVSFAQRLTYVYQEKREKRATGWDNTGWQVWECSNVMLRYLRNDERIVTTLQQNHQSSPPFSSSFSSIPISSPPSSSFSLSVSVIPTHQFTGTTLLDNTDNPPSESFSKYRILDLSSGVGLIALACAKAGCRVYVSDIPEQLDPLCFNILRNYIGIILSEDTVKDIQHIIGKEKYEQLVYKTKPSMAPIDSFSSSTALSSSLSSSSSIEIFSYFWGDSVDKLQPLDDNKAHHSYQPYIPTASSSTSYTEEDTTVPPSIERVLAVPLQPSYWYDMIIISDILYIAIRDKFIKELMYTLREITKICKTVLFGFEERLIPEETAFMNSLYLGYDYEDIWNKYSTVKELPLPSPYPSLSITELTGPITKLQKDEALQGVGGFRDTDMGDMFWEPPPIRMFLIQKSTEK